MSVSKLESLPNEILADLLEKYINGIDILTAFAFQLNRRFDTLIIQCQRLRFDFMRCHKDHFRFCVGLLPAYIDKIGELALSEQNTPGQIHAFLSFFPSFTLFKQLRKLYLHINGKGVDRLVIEKALDSLSKTNLNVLSIKITNSKTISSLNNAIVKIFRMKTLNKFSIACSDYEIKWASLNEISSNIEYLTIEGLNFEFQDLKYIFQCASGLKHLNIQLVPGPFRRIYIPKSSSENSITQMSMLRTVIFKIQENDEKTPIMLEPYLRVMPSLHHLEIQSQRELHGISDWETLLKTSLPTVTYFKLQGGAFHLKDDNINALASIQTPFWIGKKNFYVVLKKLTFYNHEQFYSYGRQNAGQYGSDSAVSEWWIGPQRKPNDNQSAMNTISALNFFTESSSLLQDHYLDNLNHLIVQEFNDNLLELLTTHVNCSQIKHLDISSLKENDNRISLLLPYTRNIISVRINFKQLSDNQFAHFRECNKLKFVDLSSNSHDFDKKHISIIANMFPNIEHLVIDTPDLRNFPILQTYLPHLRSLTFATMVENSGFNFDTFEEEMDTGNLSQRTRFLFEQDGNWVTVWIDQAALQDSYWQIADPKSMGLSDDW